MVRIMSDTGSLFSTEEGAARGVYICPLSVTIDQGSYTDYDEMDPARFLDLIAAGHMPTSSQPSQGAFIEGYEKLAGDKIIDIAMADGLSGTYGNAAAAAEQVANSDDITVVNSRTLGGPQNYLVRTAAAMAEHGADERAILDMLAEVIPSISSFLIPADLGFVLRGGRLIKMDARLARVLKVVPVLEQTADGRHLGFHGIHRKDEKMAASIVSSLGAKGVGEAGGKGWIVCFSHADNPKRTRILRTAVREAFPEATVETFGLPPSFIVQGGPGCVAVQPLRRWHGDVEDHASS